MVFVPKLSPSFLLVKEILKPCHNPDFKNFRCWSFWNYIHVTFISHQLVSPMLNNFINIKNFVQQNNQLYLPEVGILGIDIWVFRSKTVPLYQVCPPRWNPPWRGEGAYRTKRFSPQCINKWSSSERCGYVR